MPCDIYDAFIKGAQIALRSVVSSFAMYKAFLPAIPTEEVIAILNGALENISTPEYKAHVIDMVMNDDSSERE